MCGAMDASCKLEELWSKLPSDLVDYVLARLPCPSLFRFRCVCKRWNSLPSSPEFLKLCTQAPLQKRPAYFFSFQIYKPNCIIFYDPTSLPVWKKTDLQFLLKHLSLIQLYDQQLCDADGGPKHLRRRWNDFCDADGGLFCMKGHSFDCKQTVLLQTSYIVFNPLLKRSRQLPAMPCPALGGRHIITKLVVDKSTKTYKLIVVSHSDGTCWTHVYSSISQCWSATGIITAVSRSSELLIATSAICGNVLYAIIYVRTTSYILQFSKLLAYDIASGVWTEVCTQLPTTELKDNYARPQLLECHGRLLLVIAGPQCFRNILCELNASTLEWKEITFIPDRMGESLQEVYVDPTNYRLGHEYNYFVLGYGDLVLFKYDFEKRTLAYDLVQGLWSWLPIATNTGFSRLGENMKGLVGDLSLGTTV